MSSEVQNLKFKIQMPSTHEEFKLPNIKKITLKDVIDWVQNKQDVAEDVKVELIAKLKQMPEGSYKQFAKNFRGYVSKIIKRKRKEEGDNNQEISTENPSE